MEDIIKDFIENREVTDQKTRVEKVIDKFGNQEDCIDWLLEKAKKTNMLAKAQKEYAKEQKELAEQTENKAESCKELLDNVLQTLQRDKHESKYGKVSYRKSTKVIENMEELPDEYKKEKVSVVADKVKIKEDLQAGKEIKGAYLEESRNIQVK